MPTRPANLRKWLIVAGKLAIIAMVVYFLGRAVLDSVERWKTDPPQLGPGWPGWLALAAALYLAGFLPEALFWRRILRALGQDARLGETLRAYYIGHLGKYVPGKVLVIVLRAGLVRSDRVDAGVAAAGVFMSTFAMMAVGAFLSASIVGLWFGQERQWLWASIGFALVSALITLPPVFTRLVRMTRLGRSNPAVMEKLADLRFRTLLAGWAAMVAGWGLLGTHFWALVRAMGQGENDFTQTLHVYVATAALSVVLGFVSGLPGGIGARESVVTEFLPKMLGIAEGKSFGLIIALLHRVVSVVAELVISTILYIGGKRESGAGRSLPSRSERRP